MSNDIVPIDIEGLLNVLVKKTDGLAIVYLKGKRIKTKWGGGGTYLEQIGMVEFLKQQIVRKFINESEKVR